MKPRWVVLLSLILLIGAAAPSALAQPPSEGGLASDTVKYVKFVPWEVGGTAAGARIVGHYMYVTSWRSISIYDLTYPTSPELKSQVPIGAEPGDHPFAPLGAEDPATNGNVLVFSEAFPNPANTLHIWDVRDKSDPHQIAKIFSAPDAAYPAANHTMTCLLNCKWLWGSEGAIVDLHDPARPKVIQHLWTDGLPGKDGHNADEVKPGFVVTSTEPMMYLDARDPVHPSLLATGTEAQRRFVHSVQWPRSARDRFVITVGENNFTPRCEAGSAAFITWDATRWKATGEFVKLHEFQLHNGAFVDGSPPANAAGCSTHWQEQNPSFRNGGIVAMGAYEHGTRFLRVGSKGKISEAGWFEPFGGMTSAAYWVTNRIVYAIDYVRGFDILEYAGRL